MSKSLYVVIPDELYEGLREHCYERNTTKKAAIVTALENLLNQKAYTKPRPTPLTTHPKPTQPKSIIDRVIIRKKGDMPFT